MKRYKEFLFENKHIVAADMLSRLQDHPNSTVQFLADKASDAFRDKDEDTALKAVSSLKRISKGHPRKICCQVQSLYNITEEVDIDEGTLEDTLAQIAKDMSSTVKKRNLRPDEPGYVDSEEPEEEPDWKRRSRRYSLATLNTKVPKSHY